MTDSGEGRERLAELRSERFRAAQVEESLRRSLEQERSRAAALERDLDALRSSESFRLGHAFVQRLERLPRRPGALARAAYDRLAGRTRPDPGRSPAGEAAPRGPNTVLFVAWGVGETQLAQHVDRVRRLQTVLVDLQPLFLVDSDVLGPLRDSGYAAEYVIPLDEWRRHRPPHEWGAYVARRVAAVRERHRPRTVVVLDGDGALHALDQGAIHAIIVPAVGWTDDNLLEED